MRRRSLLQLLGSGASVAVLPSGVLARTGGSSRIAPAIAAAFEPEGASLNLGWRFYQGDIVAPSIKEQSAAYVAAKAGGARGAAAPNYNDSEWRTVDLPHDWAMETPPQQSENIAQGYRKRGYGWYRRAIALDPSLRGRYLEIQFGAISTNATVWFNGTPVAHNWSGYNGFSVDISSMAFFGEKPNVLAIRVDAESAEGWWYEGAGIYRDVRLIDRPPVSIATDGVHADPRQASDGIWSVPVEVTVYSIEKQSAPVSITTELLDAEGKVLASATGQGASAPLGRASVTARLSGFQPRLWSVEEPNLYSVRTRLVRDGQTIDERTTPCGFRTIRFDAQQGFFLNGVRTKLKGVCLHQDHAGVGVAVPPALVEWRVRQIKAMGANAIRCSHGAPDVSLLDACDRLGVLVMDENRNFNVSPEYLEQLEWLVRRDRNRPSIILWSVFNEEPFQGTPVGYEMVRRAVAAVKTLDASRPVTAALSNGMFTPVNVSQVVDVVGFNYQHAQYDRFHKENPNVPMMSSEDTSGFMTRGEWQTDKERKIRSSDDSQHASWGLSQRESWKSVDSRPFLAGGFVWTALDYHGEPTPEKWPANSSYFGIMDLCGFPKSAFYLRRALWIDNEPVLHILPHWNWSGREGQPIKVMLATNLERVELSLNGKKIADGVPDRYEMITFDVPYQFGTLEARGYRGGRVVARDSVQTTGAPVRLKLSGEGPTLLGDGVDAQPIRIEALDQRGRPVPIADNEVTLTITGGRIIGVGNGDPTSTASSKGNKVKLFNGKAQVIVQSERGSSGRLTLTATAPQVRSGGLVIEVKPAERRESLPPSLQQSVSAWRQSPVMAERPKTIPDLADNDMNRWDQVIAGERPPAASSNGFVILVTKIKLTGRMAEQGAALRFGGITGAGEVLVNGRSLARKATEAAGPLTVSLPAGTSDLTVAVVLQAVAGEGIGLSGPVFLEAVS